MAGVCEVVLQSLQVVIYFYQQVFSLTRVATWCALSLGGTFNISAKNGGIRLVSRPPGRLCVLVDAVVELTMMGYTMVGADDSAPGYQPT